MSTSAFRQRQRFLHGSLLFMTIFTLVVSCVNLVCFSHLRVLGKVDDEELPELIAPINWTCRRLLDIFGSSQPDSSQPEDHEHGHGHKHSGSPFNGLLLQGFALPLLAVTCLTYFLSPESELFNKKKQGEPETAFSHLMMCTRKSLRRIGVGGAGDPNMTGWALFVVGIPALLVTFLPQVVPLAHIQSKVPALASMPSIASRIYMLANPAGIAATTALALFLIPVAKHSSLLKVFGLSFTQALAFHRTAGWISLVFTLLHGILYCLIYGLFATENESFLKAMGGALFPPWPSCWTRDLFLLRGGEDANNCYGYWRNFTGVISVVAFLVLGITSLPTVRRKMYRLFYLIHIPCAWIMMIAAIAHYSFIVLFLLPNIIYYLGTTVPVWVSQLLVARRNKGFQLHSITPIEASNGCYVVRLPHNYHQQTTGTKFGGVCKICLPEISSIWHPFSVILDPKDPAFLVFLIRGVGPFTKALLERMLLLRQKITSDEESATTTTTTIDDEGQFDDADGSKHDHQSSSLPVVLLDGLYPAEHRWHSNSLSHESVLLVAGGVGIVPFISLLSELHHTITSIDERSQQCNLRRVSLHWYCREEGLARFVCGKYLKHFVEDSTASADQFADIFDDEEDIGQSHEVLFEIFVHVTSKSTSEGNLSDNVLLSSSDDSSSIYFNESSEKRVLSKPYLSLQSQEDEKIPRFLLICAFLGACLLAHYLYWWHVIDTSRMIVSRTYIVFTVFLITIILGCVISYLQLRRPSFRLIHERMDEDDNEETTDTEAHTMYEAVPMPLVRKRLTISSGRPSPADVVASVAASDNSGALFCGPSPLRKSIKKAIVEERRRLKGRFHSPCAIYDEQSEM